MRAGSVCGGEGEEDLPVFVHVGDLDGVSGEVAGDGLDVVEEVDGAATLRSHV